MAKQTINLGTIANDGTGDPLRTAFTKINANFDELYAAGVSGGIYFNNSSKIVPDGSNLEISALNYLSINSEDYGQIEIGRYQQGGVVVLGGLNTPTVIDGELLFGETGTQNLVNAKADENLELTVNAYERISHACYIPNTGEFVADIEFDDDITLVGTGWVVTINEVEYTVTEVVPDVPANQFRLAVPDAVFIQNEVYEFRSPEPVSKTWTIRSQTGALVAPGGAIITSESFDNGEGQTYRDYNIELPTPDGLNEHRWSFRNDGKLILPIGGDIVDDNGDSVLGGGPVFALIKDGATVDSLASLQQSYIEAFTVFADAFYNNQNEAGFPWGLQLPLNEEIGFQYYDQLIVAPPGQIPGAVVTTANAVKLSYIEWRAEVVSSTISSGEKQWSFDNEGNITLPTNGKILTSAGDEVVNRVRRWTNSNNNTWRIEEESGGVEFEYAPPILEQRNALTTADLTDVNYVDIDDSTYPGFYTPDNITSLVINGVTYEYWGNEWLGGGTTYRYYLGLNGSPASISYSQETPIVANVQVDNSNPEPVLWWDGFELPSEGVDLRGAIIDYHAFSQDCGTVIGTIKIAIDSGDNTVTHSEVTSGGSDTAALFFWGRSGNERQLYFYRNDGESDTVMIQWTAKLFYGAEFWD